MVKGAYAMKKLVVLFLLILLAGCSSGQSYAEGKLDNRKTQSFVASLHDENGVHLYDKGDSKELYVYLNGNHVIQGEKATYFTDFHVPEDGDILEIHFSTGETEDFNNESLKHELLYKIHRSKSYDNIKVFCNGQKTSFGTIYVE